MAASLSLPHNHTYTIPANKTPWDLWWTYLKSHEDLFAELLLRSPTDLHLTILHFYYLILNPHMFFILVQFKMSC